ncbi:hypothetical protein [Paraburkholderia oxyphila]|uniref:hypothetical protein n=1 Tax=Paraburkholderia oxyphila TaxID=614212 RepID=UPI000488FDF6|nr:hypothetical protein [Paraburkholderia oxyphila]
MGDLANRYGGARQSATKVIAVGDVAAEIAPPGVWSIKCPKGLRDGLIVSDSRGPLLRDD